VIENFGSTIENLVICPSNPDAGRMRPSPKCNQCAGVQNSVVCWSVRFDGGERFRG